MDKVRESFFFLPIREKKIGLISLYILGAVYSARVDGTDKKYTVKLLIWQQSLLTTERLKHRGVVGFLNEVSKMIELQEKSEHIVKLIDVHAKTTEVFGQLR